jgi:hypothetical protein
VNERIKELAQEHFCRQEYDSGSVHECYEFSAEELEKFAELIVRECADVGSKFSLAHPEAIRYQIKRHFGFRS